MSNSNSDVLIQQFNNLLKEYQDISNHLTTSSLQVPFQTIPNAMLIPVANQLITLTTNDINSCQHKCTETATCTGGTFFQDNLCTLSKGNTNEFKYNAGSNAFVESPLYYTNVLQQLNKQLIKIQKQIMQELQQEQIYYNTNNKFKEAQKRKMMHHNYDILKKEQKTIERMLQQNMEMNEAIDNGAIVITSFQYQYILYFIIVIFLLFMFGKFLMF